MNRVSENELIYEPKQFVSDDFKKEWNKQLMARIGLVLLGFGFFLQMVGN